MKILVACGGTGGHILPAIRFLEQLKDKQPDLDILLVLTRRKIEERIVPAGYRVAYIDVSPIKGPDLKAATKLLLGVLQSTGLILRFRPKVVVGFGSYASFAPVFCAKLCGIKTIIHEQNVQPGLANRLLAKFSDRIAVSFAQTEEWFKRQRKKVIFTGNPKSRGMLRVSRQEALKFFGFSEDKFTILVMGGSQGSQRINSVFLGSLEGIERKDNLQVIHLCGANDLAALSCSYEEAGVAFKLYEFLEPMHYAYSAADLAITRAGATTIAELIFFRLPAVIIPYPFAYRHQGANAELIAKVNAGISIEDSALNSFLLKDIISGLYNDRAKLEAMRAAYKHLEATSYQQDLSELVLSLCG